MNKSKKLLLAIGIPSSIVVAGAVTATAVILVKEKKQNEAKIKLAKENYEKKIGELNSFISEIASESKYQEVRNELETKKSQESAKLNEKSSADDYKNADDLLNKALESAKAKKAEIDRKEAELAQAEQDYNAKVAEATQLDVDLSGHSEYDEIKADLERELALAKASVEEQPQPTKEDYDSAASQITSLINRTKQQKERKDQEIAAAKEAERQAAIKLSMMKKLAKQQIMQQMIFQVITNIKQ